MLTQQLLSDAVPSIFPWSLDSSDDEMDSITSEEGGEIENVDAIKKFIEAQEKEIRVQKLVDLKSNKDRDDSVSNRPSQEETTSVCSSVIDMVINESELEIARKSDDKSKDSFSPSEKGKENTFYSIIR